MNQKTIADKIKLIPKQSTSAKSIVNITIVPKTKIALKPIANITQDDQDNEPDEPDDRPQKMDNSDSSLDTVKRHVLVEVGKELSKGHIMNDDDVGFLIGYILENTEIDDDLLENYVSMIISELMDSKQIYVRGNQKSYFDIVRNHGYISFSEAQQKEMAQSNAICVDTEFPINKEGLYIFE